MGDGSVKWCNTRVTSTSPVGLGIAPRWKVAGSSGEPAVRREDGVGATRAMMLLLGAALVAFVAACAAPPSRSPEHAGPGTFSPTGSMTTGRFWPSVTLLQDGRVLVAGGLDTSLKPLASAELYDPSTGSFSPTGRMATARSAQAALLADGRVLVVGGATADGTSIATAELFDPGTGTFSPTGSLAVARDWPGVALLADGRVLVAGGYRDRNLQDRLIASAEIYDPRTGAFSPTGSMAAGRAAMATRLADGRVLIAGGGKGAGGSAAELYDPGTGTFSPTGPMTVPRTSPGVALLADGRVLVAGGSQDNGARIASAELYDPATGAFAPTGSMTTPREVPATLLTDGRVLVAGGPDPLGVRLTSAELFDPKTGSFTPTGSMTVPRYWPSLARLADGRVLVLGFSSADGSTTGADSAELYR
jgi:hypothetical protein